MTARLGIPKFSGGFKTFSVVEFNNREQGTESRFLVYSQGSRDKVIEYLWLKLLWDELSRPEMELFLALPEVLNSEMKYGALRALLLKPKREIRHRLVNCSFLEKKERPTRDRYQGYQRLDVEIKRITRNLPKVPKYSGYVKSASSVGTKSPGRSSFLDPLAVIENDYMDNSFDWFTYLTVGDLHLLPSELDRIILTRL